MSMGEEGQLRAQLYKKENGEKSCAGEGRDSLGVAGVEFECEEARSREISVRTRLWGIGKSP